MVLFAMVDSVVVVAAIVTTLVVVVCVVDVLCVIVVVTVGVIDVVVMRKLVSLTHEWHRARGEYLERRIMFHHRIYDPQIGLHPSATYYLLSTRRAEA